MNASPKIPLPGKIVSVVEGEVLKKVAFISVEEHVQNCGAFLNFVSPDADTILKNALLFHDIGKKLFRYSSIYLDHGDGSLKRWGRNDMRETLRQDYTATMRPDLKEPVGDGAFFSAVADAYLSFVGLNRGGKSAAGVKCYPVRSDPGDPKSPVIAANYVPGRPFENHAAPIEADHLPKNLGDGEYRGRLAALIRLHHGFQVPRIVSEAADWEEFPKLLYDLMTMDHLGSSWAERLVLDTEGGAERSFPGGVDFGEISSGTEGDPEVEANSDGTKTVSARLRLRAPLGKEDSLPFSITYFVKDVDYVDPSLTK